VALPKKLDEKQKKWVYGAVGVGAGLLLYWIFDQDDDAECKAKCAQLQSGGKQIP
jgi:hypothetical protein